MTSKAPVVTRDWVKEHINEVVVVDCSWWLTPKEHSPKFNMRWFDIDAICAADSDPVKRPHMLPTPEEFQAHMKRLNIKESDHLLLVDELNGLLLASARVWWTFKVFGHKGEIHILEGGIENFPADVTPKPYDPSKPSSETYNVNFQADKVWNAEQMVKNAKSQDKFVVDARSPGRCDGTGKEPRKGIAAGSVPGAASVFWRPLLVKAPESTDSAEFSKFKDNAEMKKAFEESVKKPFVLMCGSGVTAATVMVAMLQSGFITESDLPPLYDGSWTEYSQIEDAPKQHYTPQQD
eukprot:TRINITY_DN8077_c0_g1_i1.p1 TRINITY_DN8077_c0_g1~~TRINITY_DN8077_c0_g1_i1.p1  ORF type:complete len:301 (-),score=66.31 TRINITY_DN8077_c0_g1_i1:124-1002(-)